MNPADLVIPEDLDLEHAVLGSLLIEQGARLDQLSGLEAADFSIEHHRWIYTAVWSLVERGAPVDLLTVAAELRAADQLEAIGGQAQLAFLVEVAATSTNVEAYARDLINLREKRELLRTGEQLVRDAQNGSRASELTPRLRALIERIDRRVSPATLPEPELRREGFDLVLTWPDGARILLSAIRDGRDGVRGELTVSVGDRRLSWGAWSLSSTQAREQLRRKLESAAPGLPWGARLEDAAFRLTRATREGEPIVTLTGETKTSPQSPVLMPRLLYAGQATQVHADGDTGKSMFALAVAIAMQSGTALPGGLKPTRPVNVAILDWETSQEIVEPRLAHISAGLGIDPPPILYKRMAGPLVDQAAELSADFARRAVECIVIDSKMFAVGGGEGGAFHEPIVAFYNALRLFAPAATLVVNHITNESAKNGAPARPFGGAFAFNGPRLIWEAKRDHEIDDATVIAFTCRKANNLPRKPDPFALRFQAGEDTITIYPFDVREATPQTIAGASLSTRLRIALTAGPLTVEALGETTGAGEDSIRKTLNRGAKGGVFVAVPDTKPQAWALGSIR